ncbi:MAG TPA: acyl-ACP--UDP-N-acetylglucosamine O-acyltransferase [Abditibacteriaceae bacterium]|jgi:UDP-N-acetylglucosamine acyltransferase|nr:acyl-ACP--UDP-N-acetylglucosamine O-acyltransferase [Abditibacteriaceae bacterium]
MSEMQERPRSRVQMAKTPFPPLSMPLGYEEICQILPHRYPFLLVDKIVELEPGVRCVGVKSVTANEEHFQGHFPGHPVMPGVLILEAMAQVAGILTLVSRNTPGALSYFAKIEQARFHHPVRPGDQLVTEATLQVLRGSLCKVNVVGRVDGEVVVEADYTFFTTSDSAAASVVTTQNANLIAMSQNAAAPSHASLSPSANGAPGNGATPSATTPDVVPIHNADSTSDSVNNTRTDAVQDDNASSNGVNRVLDSAAKPVERTVRVLAPRESTGQTYIDPTALVDSDAQIGQGVWIGPHCIIEGDTQIGDNTVLEANVLVKSGTSIGQRCRIWPNVILGHEPQDMKYRGEKSFLRIGDDNILREMVTIHRGTGEGTATTIGNRNMLMAYVHIGHNCTIGNNNMISNSTGFSGHVTVEDKVVIGGFVGVHQFVHIGRMAMVGGLSKVVQDVPPFCTCDGRPAKVHGLNTRGLRRNGVSVEQRMEVGTAFKLLYRSNLNTSQALERIHAEVPHSPTLDYFIEFIERVREGRLGRQDENTM